LVDDKFDSSNIQLFDSRGKEMKADKKVIDYFDKGDE